MNHRLLTAATAVALLASSFPAKAAFFPDVPDGHLFQEPIEVLVNAGVINGNPDGTFRPNDAVNRAEMIKMLYLATGRLPDPLNIHCFADVEPGSWYEPYVCDAAARRFVQGYSNDSTFRPNNAVNRVEALKMIMEVFEIPVAPLTSENREVIKFVDVSTSAWYSAYLYTAFETGVLPVAGMDSSRFYPETPLSRGEAAAYIYNAITVDLYADREQSSSSSSVQYSSQNSEEASSSTSSASSSSSTALIQPVGFPFQKEGKFSHKNAVSYKFNISGEEVVAITAKLQSGQPGGIVCRLYKIENTGFTDEYFLGYEEGNACYITAAVGDGSYQLQVQPTQSNTTFTVSVERGSSDGSDGFIEAERLNVNTRVNGTIAGGDFEDWFMFSLISEQKMTVEVKQAAELRCIVYEMSDVTLASFSGPECNQSYVYPPGTYFISVGRKAPKTAQQSYSIELKK